MEYKGTGAAVRGAQRRPSDQPIRCGRCRRPASTALLASLGPTTRYICPGCRGEGTHIGMGTGYLRADELDEAAQLAGVGIDHTPLKAFELAATEEVPWYLNPDGTLGPGAPDGWSAQRRR